MLPINKMAYRRYRKRGVRPRRKSRYQQRRKVYKRSMRMPRQISNRVLMIRKQRLMPAITGGGIADLFYNAAYTTTFDLNNAAWDLSALQGQFEQIKAYKFIVSLEPLQNQSSSAVPNAYIRRVIDNQDQNAYLTEAQYLANADCKSHGVQANKTITFVVYPKSNLQQSFGTASTLKACNPGWVNTTLPQMPGFIPPHVFIPTGTAGVGMFNVRVTAIVGFKHNK